jgi:hypothetical protein
MAIACNNIQNLQHAGMPVWTDHVGLIIHADNVEHAAFVIINHGLYPVSFVFNAALL